MQRNRGKQQNGKDHRSLQNIRDAKGIFHAKMGSIKDKIGRNLTGAEDIRDGKNTQKNYTKKVLMTQVTTMV